MENDDLYAGFKILEDQVSDILAKALKTQDILVAGAEAMVKDLRALPQPYSKLKRTNSKHMLDTIGYRRAKNDEVEIGAGVYWLRFVENGTAPSSKRKWSTPKNPFLKRTWEANKERYYRIMIKKAGLE